LLGWKLTTEVTEEGTVELGNSGVGAAFTAHPLSASLAATISIMM